MNTALLLLGMAMMVAVAAIWIGGRIASLAVSTTEAAELVRKAIAEQDAASAADLHVGFTQQTDRTRDAMQTLGDRMRDALAQEMERMARLASDQRERQDAAAERFANALAASFETLRGTLVEQVEKLAQKTDGRLEQISGKVEERLEEGFRKTNETFVNVMTRLACIDEAQKKIDGLATNVVGLKEILGDKRARGAFGEVQLEGLVRDVLPAAAFAMQHTFATGARADCALFLPEPTGTVAVDSKFPLESYRRMTDGSLPDAERRIAERQFESDVKRHVDDIASKYIIPGETSEGAVMFVPAESVFGEIHDRHPKLVEYARVRRVWIVSPSTLMAVLNTARAVLKDVETRKQVNVIKENLSKLGKEFERFDKRMQKLADHIRLAHEDAADVHTSSRKISEKFRQIEGVELTEGPVVSGRVESGEERTLLGNA